MSKYRYANHDYDLSINYGFAIKTLAPDFGVDLTKILQDDTLQRLFNDLYLNDDLAIKLWIYYLDKHLGEGEAFKLLDNLTSSELTAFKDAFWSAIEVFMGPLRSPILKEAKKGLIKAIKDNAEKLVTSAISSSNSSESQE